MNSRFKHVLRICVFGGALSLLSYPTFAECGAATFTPNRLAANGFTYASNPPTHNALYLTDPSNQQYAVFDMEWGGTLASLRYMPAGGVYNNGQVNASAQELVWGNDPGGMIQPALWTGNSYYNPEQAGDVGQDGDWGRGSPVYGGACKNGSMLYIQTSTVDFFRNDPPWGIGTNYDRAAAIYQGVPRAGMWSTPYAVTLTASFVPNPGGSPAYYLKLDFFWQSTDVLEDFGGAFWTFALYAPGTTDPPLNGAYNPQYGANSFKYSAFLPAGCSQTQGGCPGGQQLIAGLYPAANLTGGIAISTNAAAYLAGQNGQYTGPGFDTFWNSCNVTLSAAGSWQYSPGSGRRFIVYVLAGDWSQASAFMPQ